MITTTRHHDISTGHRVFGHQGFCRFVHGHGYRFVFTCTAPDLDKNGMITDFGVMKSALCEWVEKIWDHKLLLWDQDPLSKELHDACEQNDIFRDAFQVVRVPFNPTAENMAQWLLENGDDRLPEDVQLIAVTVQETRKCSATATLDSILGFDNGEED